MPSATATPGGDIGDPNSPLIKQLIASHNHPSTQADRDKTPLTPDPNRIVYYVRPQDTDSAINTFLQDHYVIYNKAVPQNGKLFVFFPGTFGRPHDYQLLINEAANQGYKAIGLEYPDDTDNPNASAVGQICAQSSDPSCFNAVRQVRLTGTGGGTYLTVTPANAIENRLLKLLLYLQRQHPDEGWDAFLQQGQIAWSQIAVGGHSQGSGFAAFIAKQQLVARVAMWSGPADYSTAARRFAPWMTQISVTPAASYFGIVHQHEPTRVGILAGWTTLGMSAFGAPVVATQAAAPSNGNHQLIVTAPPRKAASAGDAYHGSTATDTVTPLDANGQPVYKSAWDDIIGA